MPLPLPLPLTTEAKVVAEKKNKGIKEKWHLFVCCGGDVGRGGGGRNIGHRRRVCRQLLSAATKCTELVCLARTTIVRKLQFSEGIITKKDICGSPTIHEMERKIIYYFEKCNIFIFFISFLKTYSNLYFMHVFVSYIS